MSFLASASGPPLPGINMDYISDANFVNLLDQKQPGNVIVSILQGIDSGSVCPKLSLHWHRGGYSCIFLVYLLWRQHGLGRALRPASVGAAVFPLRPARDTYSLGLLRLSITSLGSAVMWNIDAFWVGELGEHSRLQMGQNVYGNLRKFALLKTTGRNVLPHNF